MFFKKSQIPQKTILPNYAWQKVDAKQQNMWINVIDWQFKVFPLLKGNTFGTFIFQFEGTAKMDLQFDIGVGGDIEIRDSTELPGMFSDHWSNVPDHIEGYCFFMKSDDPTISPSFAVTLYCKESAIDWICRAFSIGMSNKGAVGIELQIDCPNQNHGDFWQDQWKDEWLRVTSWKIFSSAQLR